MFGEGAPEQRGGDTSAAVTHRKGVLLREPSIEDIDRQIDRISAEKIDENYYASAQRLATQRKIKAA